MRREFKQSEATESPSARILDSQDASDSAFSDIKCSLRPREVQNTGENDLLPHRKEQILEINAFTGNRMGGILKLTVGRSVRMEGICSRLYKAFLI